MSRTKRNNSSSEVSRSAKPYKRKRFTLNEFERSYIARNNHPDHSL